MEGTVCYKRMHSEKSTNVKYYRKIIRPMYEKVIWKSYNAQELYN